MTTDTPLTYRNLAIYEIFVRNHGPNGNFADVQADLPRIRSMGIDVIWFMPIHPIGKVARKGTLGSPYAIQDYREVNPEYGTRQDFFRLVEHAHKLGLKVMLDVVYNHTAPDAVLASQHPEYFQQNASGQPITHEPDWSDVIDLRHQNPELIAYLIETLQSWVHFGVDGFRCDAAATVPVDFWRQARAAVAEVKSGIIWLAESVHAEFIRKRRSRGLIGHSDSELYTAFDLTYDYDIWPIWQSAVRGAVPVSRYLELLRFQDCIYPANFVKLRCVENHDQRRILGLAPTRAQALAWTAFQAFNKGAFLIYSGQEAAATHTASLVKSDKIEWGNYELQPYLTQLVRIKKDPALIEGQFILLSGEPAVQATWQHPKDSLYGVFNVSGATGNVEVELPDGDYLDLLSETKITVQNRHIPLPESAAILRSGEAHQFKPIFSELLDYTFPPR
jgi:hypothetical protein